MSLLGLFEVHFIASLEWVVVLRLASHGIGEIKHKQSVAYYQQLLGISTESKLPMLRDDSALVSLKDSEKPKRAKKAAPSRRRKRIRKSNPLLAIED